LMAKVNAGLQHLFHAYGHGIYLWLGLSLHIPHLPNPSVTELQPWGTQDGCDDICVTLVVNAG
jgi:hypothetical protein